MIRPIASLEQRRRKRIHHNILSGVVDRAELIRGRPKAAIDSIRRMAGWIWWASINNISTIPRLLPRIILTVRSIDRSIEESIDIKNAIMVQFSPNRIFTAAIILLRYAPLSPSLRPPLWTAACWQRSLCLGFAPAPVTTILLSSSVEPMHDFISLLTWMLI